MSGRHSAPKVRRLRLGAIGIASAGVLLAATSGVAVASVGTTVPAPEDCTALVQALITAQVGEDRNANAVRKAEREDDAAKSVHDQAVIDAETAYKTEVAAAPADNLATKDVDEHKVATDKATDKRDKAKARADQAYTDGKTADRLTAARGKESKTSAALGVIKLDIGKVCTRTPQQPPALTPPSPPEAQQSQVAPAPETVQAHLPVTH